MNAMPSSAMYKERVNEKRRVLIQEDEDEDTDVIFWDENTKPEDIMDGKDLEDYYLAERSFRKHDNSSTDAEQKKQFQELSRMFGVDPKEVEGYKVFFEEKQSLDSGMPSDVSSAFMFFDSLLQTHPELQEDFDRWQAALEKVSKMDVKRMSNKEFERITACPPAILQCVDKDHLPLFQVHRSDFLHANSTHRTSSNSTNRTSSNSTSTHEEAKAVAKESEPKETPDPVQKGNVALLFPVHRSCRVASRTPSE